MQRNSRHSRLLAGLKPPYVTVKDYEEEIIAVWPDGEWCEEEEISEFCHKSDDYYVHTVKVSGDQTLEEAVQELILNGQLVY